MRPGLSTRFVEITLAIAVFLSATANAQYGGPHTTNTVGGHFLAPPPSVTSIGGGSHLPPPTPSVTSIPNIGLSYHGSYVNGYGRHGHGYGYVGGYGYSIPYYYPADNSAYGYDYVGGGGSPDLYSGPPPGPSDPVLHVIVEQPPAQSYGPPPETRTYAPPLAAPPAPASLPEVKPGEPVVLVFRNGHKQEVTNYAIMGETLYVFDDARKKIALADLDIPATVKANDDRGLEFRMPPTTGKKKVAPTPQSGNPDSTGDSQPRKIAALLP